MNYFYDYIHTVDSPQNSRFRTIFLDTLDNLPRATNNSRVIMKQLAIKTDHQFRVFHESFMNFLKWKMLN
ncbi:hypothetical protein EB077_01160 [bacterium]|nr:hypothetical protein [bacterium]NDC93908.1 hypothetical protein [bacterium]